MSNETTFNYTCTHGNLEDSNDPECFNVVDSSEVVTSFTLAIIGGVLVLGLYSVLRNFQSWKPIYHKRATQISDLLFRPPPLRFDGLNKIWSFLFPVFNLSDGDLFKTGGLDSLMLVRINLFGMHVFLPLSVVGLAVLLPVYRTGDGLEDTTTNAYSLMLFSMANLSKKDPKLWAPLLLYIAFCMYCLWALYLHMCSYAALRSLHLHVLELSGPLLAPLGPRQVIMVGKGAKRGFWFAIFDDLMQLISPLYMHKNDMKFLNACIKEFQKKENRDMENVRLDEGSQARELLLPFEHKDLSSLITSTVHPWWQSPEDIPACINSVYKPGGLLLAKSFPLLQQRCLGALDNGTFAWTSAHLYVVLFRDANVANRKQWFKIPDEIMAVRARHCQSSDTSVSVGEEASEKVGRIEKLRKTLERLYPSTFSELIPAYYHQSTDEAIVQWDKTVAAIDKLKYSLAQFGFKNDEIEFTLLSTSDGSKRDDRDAENGLSQSEIIDRRVEEIGTGRIFCASMFFKTARSNRMKRQICSIMSEIQTFLEKKNRLEQEIELRRQYAIDNPCESSCFAVFKSQRDALSACQGQIGVVPGINMVSCMAPSPEQVNFQSLWSNLAEQRYMLVCLIVPYAIVILFPIGFLTGALSNLTVAFCGGTPETNSWYWPEFCESQLFVVKALLTGILPVAISAFWDTYFLPIVLYLMTQRLRVHESFSKLDIAITIQLYVFGVVNTFFFGVLGGAALSQVGSAIKTGDFFALLGLALPGAANFFINYVGVHALFTNFFRFVWPHDGTVLFELLRLLKLAPYPRSEREAWIIRSTPSYRGARHMASFLLIMTMALSYSVIAPVILPCTYAFFFTSWIAWRYNAIHFYQPCYDSSGELWSIFSVLFVANLHVGGFFLACTLVAYGYYWQGPVIMGINAVLIYIGNLLIRRNITEFIDTRPLHLTDTAPKLHTASVNDLKWLYMPAQLRPGAVGWFPEYNKAWEKYGLPRFTGPDPAKKKIKK